MQQLALFENKFNSFNYWAVGVADGLAARMRGLGGCEAVSEQFMGVPCSSPELRFPGAV